MQQSPKIFSVFRTWKLSLYSAGQHPEMCMYLTGLRKSENTTSVKQLIIETLYLIILIPSNSYQESKKLLFFILSCFLVEQVYIMVTSQVWNKPHKRTHWQFLCQTISIFIFALCNCICKNSAFTKMPLQCYKIHMPLFM